MNIWKFGCNWGSGKPYFDDLIRKEKIVLCWGHNFSIGDLVLIAKGHEVIAIAKIITSKTPVTYIPEYELLFKENSIEYLDEVYFCKVEWTELNKGDSFKYELQQGICQVHNQEIKNKAITLFEMYKNQDTPNYVFSLSEIANWSNTESNENQIIVEVPKLQRGLVWDQSQIELLWDSILRNIPVGSFVICPKTESMLNQSRIEKATHYLLDGQQRCNAITIGLTHFPPKEEEDPIIWIDIDTSSNNVKNSTREFLIRLTTLAHPWGYDKSDNSGKLGSHNIRKGVKKSLKKDDDYFYLENYKKPKPKDIYPFEAIAPVPLSILINNHVAEWENVINSFFTEYLWAKNAVEFIKTIEFDKYKLIKAINCAKQARIIALNVPISLLEKSNQESDSNNNIGITNIEHLFQRLNRQGTQLNGEELIYSMIKLYFPAITETIDSVAKNRMPPSRLVDLAMRVALSVNELKNSFTVTQVRKIASSKDTISERDTILNYINQSLEKDIKLVDKWLLNEGSSSDWGIPKVLKTRIAISSPDIYCLLLILANKFPNLNENQYNRIVGIILFIHWFVDDKKRAALSLYQYIIDATSDSIIEKLSKSLKTDKYLKDYFRRLLSPDLVKDIISFDEKTCKDWNWNLCKEAYLESNSSEIDIVDEYDRNVSPVLLVLRDDRDFLLYAQRKFINTQFKDYDPARKDLWKDINRPWDFDHILPSVYVKGKWDTNAYKNFCDKWINTNGNLRAWPFEDNRSDQATNTEKKMRGDTYWDNSFIDPGERVGYSDASVINDKIKAYQFGNSCKTRITRMYKEWYYNFHFEELKIF